VTKGPDAFRTISEAADELGVPQHVLRFWETKFSFIRPMKRAGGRRFYRPQDLLVLKGVRVLLHDDGYTIKGVQRLHREEGIKRLLLAATGLRAAPPPEGAGPDPAADLPAGPPADLDEDLFEQPAASDPGGDALSQDSRRRLAEALDALEAAKARLKPLISGS
jgi:DNA-binding transcriptional MerR regulator